MSTLTPCVQCKIFESYDSEELTSEINCWMKDNKISKCNIINIQQSATCHTAHIGDRITITIFWEK